MADSIDIPKEADKFESAVNFASALLTLCALPGEILELILLNLHIYDIFNLWMAGNHQLNALLGRGGGIKTLPISGIHSKPFLQHRELIEWPSILKEMRMLGQLTIHLSALTWVDNIKLGNLPPTLTYLDFSFLNAYSCIHSPEMSYASVKSGSMYHRIDASPETVFNFGSYFPQLSYLSIDTCHCMPNKTSINNELIKNLPKSLTHLTIPKLLEFDPFVIKMLPPNLTNWSFHRNFPMEENSLYFLPPSITDLEIIANPTTEQHLKSLPNMNINKLCLISTRITSSSVIKLIPRSVKELTLGFACFQMLGTHTPYFDALPSNLTKLTLSLPLQPLDGCLESLPKTLSYLEIEDGRMISDMCLKSLPNGLHTLISRGCHGLISDHGVPHLPRSLKTLILDTDKITGVSFRALPPNLLCLELDECIYIWDETAQFLPRSITHLNLSKASLGPDCIPLLPSELEHLKVANEETSKLYFDSRVLKDSKQAECYYFCAIQ